MDDDFTGVDDVVVCFTNVFYCLQTGSINMPIPAIRWVLICLNCDSLEVNNFILAMIIPDNISKYSVNSSCCIRHENDSWSRTVHEFCNCLSVLIEKRHISLANEWIWS
jgi:hypothetical protein